jgi:PadR family transcriptional regulator
MVKRPELPRVGQTEATILAALAGGELYGLEIVDEVTANGGRLSLGGVYTLLHRLEKKGLVTSRWGGTDEDRAGARRRYYELTGLGQRVLAEVRRAVGAVAQNFAAGKA